MTNPSLRSIVLATAGRTQAVVNDGGLANVKESDLRSALRDSAYPHARCVEVEVALRLPYWPRVGAVDVRIGEGPEATLAECKWCHDADKLAETLWDALKLASATAAGIANCGLVVAAASDTTWAAAPASVLFEERGWQLLDLLAQLSKQWSWLYRSVRVARPQRLPATFDATRCHQGVILGADTEPWTLRAITIRAATGMDLQLDDSGVPLTEEGEP